MVSLESVCEMAWTPNSSNHADDTMIAATGQVMPEQQDFTSNT